MRYQFSGKAISIVEPWAAAVVFAGKDIENRPKRLRYRGPVAIHASKRWWPESLDKKIRSGADGERTRLEDLIRLGRRRYGLDPFDPTETRGHIIGLGMLVDCVERSKSPWFEAGTNYGWVLAGVIPIKPIPRNGALGLWPCEFEYEPCALRPRR